MGHRDTQVVLVAIKGGAAEAWVTQIVMEAIVEENPKIDPPIAYTAMTESPIVNAKGVR